MAPNESTTDIDPKSEAARLLAEGWTVAFECPQFRAMPSMLNAEGITSEYCECGDMKYLHDVAAVLRKLASG